MKTCGTNRYLQLCVKPNNKNIDGTPIVYPPCDSNLDTTQLLSYSVYNEHSLWITLDGQLYGIGDNRYNQILETLPRKVFTSPTKIKIQDQAGQTWQALSAVCGEMYSLYLVSHPTNNNLIKLVYAYKDYKDEYPLFLNIGDRLPISIFGGSHISAAIDNEGNIIIITNSVLKSRTLKIESEKLPNSEKAVKIACCDEVIYVLSLKGHVFESKINDNERISFSEVKEFSTIKIENISGSHHHCFAVSTEGRVYGIGSNKQGRLCIESETERIEKFTILNSLKKFNICEAFAGYSHSFFMTFNGMIFGCGDNYNGNLFLSSGPSDEEEEDIYSPTATTVRSGATSCIAGWNLSVIFIDSEIPPNCPNKKVTNFKNNLTFKIESKSIKNSENNQYKKHIKELENTVKNQQEKIKELQKEILKMKQTKFLSHEISEEENDNKKIQIYDSSTIENLRTIREISKGEGNKFYEVAKEERFILKVMKIKTWNDEKKEKLIEKTEIIKTINHPNFLKMIGFCANEGSLSILHEFCEMNLHQAIKKNFLSRVEIVCSIFQIAEGMKCAHFLGLIHKNLRPSNILIDSNGIIKIADFESFILNNSSDEDKFSAPEILNNKEFDEKVDVYSFGVLMFYMLTGKKPKISSSSVSNGKQADIPDSINKFSENLIKKCWSFKSKNRPSFIDICNEIEQNKFQMIDLSKLEIKETEIFIDKYKRRIPNYSE